MRMVIPTIRTKEVLREMHNGGSGAHFGINKTLSKVRERFGLLSRRCREPKVGSPFERITVDIAGPFPVTDDGKSS